MIDTILIGFAALLNLILTFVGLFVALRVINDKKKQHILITCFVVSALLLVLSVVIAVRGNSSQEKLQGSVEHVQGSVEHVEKKVDIVQGTVASIQQQDESTPSVSPPAAMAAVSPGFVHYAKIGYVLGNEFFTLGNPLSVNVWFTNKSPVPVQNVNAVASMSLIVKNNSPEEIIDAAVIKNFDVEILKMTDHGATLGKDMSVWVTPALPMLLTQDIRGWKAR